MIDLLKEMFHREPKEPAPATVQPPQPTQPLPEVDRLMMGTETILVAEDEPAMLEYIRAALELLGYKVLAATNGEEALRMVEQHPGRKIDLLLTDLVMPRMGGKELVYRLQATVPPNRVLYCSAYPGQLASRNGMLPDQIVFLQKPTTIEKLAETVRWTLDAAEELNEKDGDDPEDRPLAPCDLHAAFIAPAA